MPQLQAYATGHDVDRIVAVAAGGYPAEGDMSAFGRVQSIRDVFVSPACGDKSLTGDTRRP
jgi:hypothetical protein